MYKKKSQRYCTRIGSEELEAEVTKVDESLYRAVGEFCGEIIRATGTSETIAFGRWYREVQREAKNREQI
ncbi:hypothetical protein RN346_04610 [Halomonas sp. PAMB 3232]|uniref:hypothetical protein n=1 Tax=Halomonas sp. PAMB 3232 TaxID=3075221 RepID=UPI00289A6EB2|nr:hypothetical protein [Halomonas sp. PAMB 3232]WNL39844.1 hypothetical protein RN346_04610 [Halomonas sp. PAMB 3232]